MLRKNLVPDVLYYDTYSEQYFFTPNPYGVIWLTDEEATDIFDEPAIVVELEKI